LPSKKEAYGSQGPNDAQTQLLREKQGNVRGGWSSKSQRRGAGEHILNHLNPFAKGPTEGKLKSALGKGAQATLALGAAGVRRLFNDKCRKADKRRERRGRSKKTVVSTQ